MKTEGGEKTLPPSFGFCWWLPGNFSEVKGSDVAGRCCTLARGETVPDACQVFQGLTGVEGNTIFFEPVEIEVRHGGNIEAMRNLMSRQGINYDRRRGH